MIYNACQWDAYDWDVWLHLFAIIFIFGPTMDSVVLETSLGDIQLELYWNHAPRVSFSHWYLLLLWLNWSRYFILDMSKLCWARKTRLLQWRRFSSDYRCESSSCKCVYNDPLYLQDFMIQGGDPTGTGRGGTSIYGQKLYVPLLYTFFHTHLLAYVQRGWNTSRTTLYWCWDSRYGELRAQYERLDESFLYTELELTTCHARISILHYTVTYALPGQ